jgi:hypothetical protein
MSVSCKKEHGSWVVRLNGVFILDTWSEVKARRVAMAIEEAIRRPTAGAGR